MIGPLIWVPCSCLELVRPCRSAR